jgi:hypothetical protein
MFDVTGKTSDFLTSITDTFLNWLSNLTHDYGYTELWYVSIFQRLKNAQKGYKELRDLKDLKSKLLGGDVDYCHQVTDLSNELRDILPKLGKQNPSKMAALNFMMRDLLEWEKMIPVNISVEYKTRVEPIWINIHGKPGVGKTSFIKPLIKKLIHTAGTRLDLLHRPENLETYNFNPSEGYFDSYSGQKIFETTDLGQTMTDEKANFTLIEAITHVVESSEYRPPVADLTKKGHIELRPIAWISDSQQSISNYRHLTQATMSGGSHILRRITYEIEVEFNPGMNHTNSIEKNRYHIKVSEPQFTPNNYTQQV